MPCADPRWQWRVNGKWTLSEPLASSLYPRQQFACGQCAPCRLSAAGEWTTRLMQESLMHPASICATLTYAPEFLPPLGSLRYSDVQAFMKALRNLVAARAGPRFSFDVMCEYSPPPRMRPHYHIALFGYYPPDYREAGRSRAGNQEFDSAELSKAWGRGRVTFQPFSQGAAQYCAGHQAWKLTGEKGHHLRTVFDESGQVVGVRERERHECSNRPGIGRRFFEAYGDQALKLGFTVSGGSEVPVPKYYLRRADLSSPELAEAARAIRRAKALEVSEKLAAEGDHRLDAIEGCAQARIERGSRKDGL